MNRKRLRSFQDLVEFWQRADRMTDDEVEGLDFPILLVEFDPKRRRHIQVDVDVEPNGDTLTMTTVLTVVGADLDNGKLGIGTYTVRDICLVAEAMRKHRIPDVVQVMRLPEPVVASEAPSIFSDAPMLVQDWDQLI